MLNFLYEFSKTKYLSLIILVLVGDGMTGIANHAKKGQHEQFSSSVRGASAAICGLVEAASQASYLVGVSDPSSVAGRPGIVDQAMLNRAAQAINAACQGLSNPASTQQQVILIVVF